MVKIKGFTLIELMVVMAILAILASLIFPAFIDMKRGSPANINTEETKYEGMVMIINGIRHKCDANGDCTPIE